MKRLFSALLVVLAMAASLTAANADRADAKPHRVVFEMTSAEPETWTGLLNNVENVRRALGEERTEIEVVVHGKALGFLKATNVALSARMQVLARAGVVFAACENTMRRQQVGKGDLLPFAVTVDSGVAEIVRRQEAGWSYIRIGG